MLTDTTSHKSSMRNMKSSKNIHILKPPFLRISQDLKKIREGKVEGRLFENKFQLLDIGSTTPSIFGGPTEFLLDLICRHSLIENTFVFELFNTFNSDRE